MSSLGRLLNADRIGSWGGFRPWQTNLALVLLGLGMIGFSRQLVREFDAYNIGTSGVSSSQIVLYLAAVVIFLLKPANVDRFTFPIILTVAIACRLVLLFPEPNLSSDVYRYAWDGVVQHAHVNPYRYVPGDPALAFLRAPNQDLFDNINRRDYARTIYPPVAQIIFNVVTWISPTVTFMKMAMVLFEGLTMWGLVLLLREVGLRREYTIVYAWCPLLIWEISSSGHLDSVVMAFAVFALLFRFRQQPMLTGLFLALAVLTKFYPIVLFPALYRRGRDNKLDWTMPATLVAVIVAAYGIYASAGQLVFGFLGGYVQEEGMATGTRYFLLDLVRRISVLKDLPNAAFLIFTAAVFLALSVWTWRRSCPSGSRRDAFLAPAFALSLALMLLFSPHYPWYIAWLVPFLTLMPRLSVMTYVCLFFYLCNTELAVGSGPKQFLLNEILYGAVAIVAIGELMLTLVPVTRTWFERRRLILSAQ